MSQNNPVKNIYICMNENCFFLTVPAWPASSQFYIMGRLGYTLGIRYERISAECARLISGVQVSTINSLLSCLGVQLEVWSEGCRMFLRQTQTPTHLPPLPPSTVRKQNIKAEPQESQDTICPARIKKERLEEKERGTPGVFPLVQSSSLLKCPNASCNFCALTVPEIEAHINQCSQEVRGGEDTSNDSFGR